MNQSKFQFSNPNLTNLSFQINDDFESENFESIKIDGSTKVFRSQDHTAIVEFTLRIGEIGLSSPFYVEATMKANFKWNEEIEENTLKKMLQVNAPSLIIGYMRPVIANITNMSEYPAFNLPFLNMQQNEAVFEEM